MNRVPCLRQRVVELDEPNATVVVTACTWKHQHDVAWIFAPDKFAVSCVAVEICSDRPRCATVHKARLELALYRAIVSDVISDP